MPVGQFMPGSGFVYRLDARVKLLCVLLMFAAVVSSANGWDYAIVWTTSFAALLVAPSIKSVLVPIRRLWFFFAFILFMNTFFFAGEEVLWSWGIMHLSLEGLKQGVRVVLNVALMVTWGNLLTLTTSPMAITSALSNLLSPLKIIRVPVDEVAMILGAAMQFVPTLLEEADMIKKAQTARGARFESRRLSEKASSVLPLVIPIFLSAFRRADELALAMEARGYVSAHGRTPREKARLSTADQAVLAGYAAIALAVLLTH